MKDRIFATPEKTPLWEIIDRMETDVWKIIQAVQPDHKFPADGTPAHAMAVEAWKLRDAIKPVLALVVYPTMKPTDEYRCCKCGVQGVRLWRDWNVMVCFTELTCADHTPPDVNRDTDLEEPITETTWMAGHKVPAIPTEACDTFWGLGAINQVIADWWKRLPLRVAKTAAGSGRPTPPGS